MAQDLVVATAGLRLAEVAALRIPNSRNMLLLGRRDLEGSEPMSVQGAYGWMVWAICKMALAPLAW